MPERVVVDSSALIALEKIGLLKILCAIYKEIILPDAVIAEFGTPALDCLVIKKVENKLVKLLTADLNLGKGESEVIAYAETTGMTVILDDEKARKIAKTMGLTVTRTIGILLKAEKLKLIDSAEAKARELKAKGFYISDELMLKIAGFKKTRT